MSMSGKEIAGTAYGPIGKKITWYFAFCEGDRTTLLSKFTRKNFSHTVFFTQAGPTTISIEPCATAININNYFDENEVLGALAAENVAIHFLQKGFTVVKHSYMVYDDKNILHLANMIPSCVSMCKIITGYRSWAVTPYQLYQSLLKDGGTELTIEGLTNGITNKQAEGTTTT